MSKATAKAYANIALVKYWGKGDEKLRLPVNSSVAVGLDKIYTTTTVEFDREYDQDKIEIDGDSFDEAEKERVVEHLDRVRSLAGIRTKAKVVTKNNFPKAVGAASSASGFAALSMAAARAARLKLNEKELSILARQGSGSAARSITGGVSVWHKGINSETSFAERISLPEEWEMRVLLVFVGDLKAKKVSTTKGMVLTQATSPYFEMGVREAEENVKRIQKAIKDKDCQDFGKVIEDECFRLHALCMTTTPNLLYWSGETVAIFQKLYELREQGIEAFFTVDAGPHVHIICRLQDVEAIKENLKLIKGMRTIVECGIGGPASLIKEHLF